MLAIGGKKSKKMSKKAGSKRYGKGVTGGAKKSKKMAKSKKSKKASKSKKVKKSKKVRKH